MADHGRSNVIKTSRSHRCHATMEIVIWFNGIPDPRLHKRIDSLPREDDRSLFGGVYRGSGRIYAIAMRIDCYRSARTDARFLLCDRSPVRICVIIRRFPFRRKKRHVSC